MSFIHSIDCDLGDDCSCEALSWRVLVEDDLRDALVDRLGPDLFTDDPYAADFVVLTVADGIAIYALDRSAARVTTVWATDVTIDAMHAADVLLELIQSA